ncbi:MAG: nucleotide pyrophosphohydrolase [Nanobdellota archaeon]
MATIKELQSKVKEFRDARDWQQFHTATNLAIGVSTEAAELLEHLRFKSSEQVKEYLSDKYNKEKFSHEAADVFIFLLALCEAEGIDLEKAFHEKLDINKKKYPVSKAKGRHDKYDEL